jgi:1-acyl-sn-glycerol-3-phosphate acyltransferase
MVSSDAKRRAAVFSITQFIAKPILSLFFRLEVGGLENLPKESAFILLPKHQRWEDVPLLGLATPRPLYYVAKYELFLNPLSGWYLSALGGLPLNRQRPLESRKTLKSMIRLLRKGEGMVIFPEGTYHHGTVGPGHVGLLRMVRSRVLLPWVPVGIRYAGEGMRTHVRVRFGEPVSGNASVEPERLLNTIMRDIAFLSEMPYNQGEEGVTERHMSRGMT